MNIPKHSFANYLLILLLGGQLAFAPIARAQTDLEQVTQEMGEAAAKAAVMKLGQKTAIKLIDKTFETAASSASSSSTKSLGTTVVGYVAVGLSVKEFIDAKDDKGRFYATLDTAAATLAITVPVAGLIAAGVIEVAKIIEMCMSAGHAREMAEIARKTQEAIDRSIKVMRAQAAGDYERIHHLTVGISEQAKKIDQLQSAIDKSCSSISATSDLETLVNCQAMAAEFFPAFNSFTNYSEQFFDYDSLYIPLDAFFKQQDVDKAAYLNTLQLVKENMQTSQAAFAQIAAMAGQEIAKAAVASALAKGNLQPVIALRLSCYENVLAFNRTANLALLSPTKQKNKSLLAAIYSDEVGSFNEGCNELHFGKEDPLTIQFAQRKLTLEALQDALGLSALAKSSAKPLPDSSEDQ